MKNLILVREKERKTERERAKKFKPYYLVFFMFLFPPCLFQITNQNHFPTSRPEEEFSFWTIS